MASPVKIAGIFATIAVAIYMARPFFQGRVCTSDARLDGKVAIVTGANTGIGKETVVDFVRRGARVIMACRSLDRCDAAAKDVIEMTKAKNKQISTAKLDLSSFASVREFVADLKKSESRLHILMNNAGIGMISYTLSEDGYETQMAVNHFGHFLLTVLLTDQLIASAPSRVVTVSSKAHTFWDINLNNLSPSEADYNFAIAYFQSKAANVLFSAELGRRLQDSGITTYSVHPGAIATGLQRYDALLDWAHVYLLWPFLKDIFHGAQTQICCAVDPALENATGKYYAEVQETLPSYSAQSLENASKLWKTSIVMTKLSIEEIHPKLR